jgi:hypothetical protein
VLEKNDCGYTGRSVLVVEIVATDLKHQLKNIIQILTANHTRPMAG